GRPVSSCSCFRTTVENSDIIYKRYSWRTAGISSSNGSNIKIRNGSITTKRNISRTDDHRWYKIRGPVNSSNSSSRVTTAIRSNKCPYLREGTTTGSNSTISKCNDRCTAGSSSGSRSKCSSDIGSRRITTKRYRSRYNNNSWRTRCTEPGNRSCYSS